MYTLRFDGLFRKIPGDLDSTSKAGFLCYGWIIVDNEVVIARGHGAFARAKDASSNVAEYLGLIEGLEALADLGIRNEWVKISGDAKCIIDQMQGAASVNSPNMKPLYRRARRLAGRFSNLEWIWTPRRNNKEADSLTRRAMRQVRLDTSNYLATVQVIDPRIDRRKQTSKMLPLMDLRVYQPMKSSHGKPVD